MILKMTRFCVLSGTSVQDLSARIRTNVLLVWPIVTSMLSVSTLLEVLDANANQDSLEMVKSALVRRTSFFKSYYFRLCINILLTLI